MNNQVQQYLFALYLNELLKTFEKRWASKPTPIELPKPCPTLQS